MARIRTVKPEAFTSESLASVTVEAERTFFGLLTQADDEGRYRDNPAIIAGVLWPLRAEHTSVHVEDDLNQLAAVGLICRYTGCDGKRYLHITGWIEHQKIDKRSQSRIPVCVAHHADQRCGRCGGPCHPRAEPSSPSPGEGAEGSATGPGGLVEGSPRTSGHAGRPAQALQEPTAAGENAPAPDQQLVVGPDGAWGGGDAKTAGQKGLAEASARTPRTLREDSTPGSRIKDPGSSSPTGRDAPAAGSRTVSAKELIAEYVSACGERPPGDVIGHLGRIVAKLLGEGIDAGHVRAGLHRYAEIQGHPSRLPSLVNDAMNGPTTAQAGLVRPRSARTVAAHEAWTNPADPAAAYAEEL